MRAGLLSKLSIAAACCLLAACSAVPRASRWPTNGTLPIEAEPSGDEDEADEGHGVAHVVVWYLPNRVFDLFDIVRARLRVGPGLAFGVRATELADVFFGSYASVWAGLPGPREQRSINWPFGLESKTGAEVSVADASIEGGVNYGFLEVGLGGQLLLVGIDVGLDVWEALDFVTGLICIDPGEDDL